MSPTDYEISEAQNALIENALSYLKKGLSEFENEFNFSTTHFYIGAELIVKSLLLNKDWRLIFQEPGDADWGKLKGGTLRSVGLESAGKRLEKITSPPINKEIFQAFKRLAAHRNKLIHFFHTGLNTPAEKKAVASDLLIAWFHLHNLFNDPAWKNLFSAFHEDIKAINNDLLQIAAYFQTIFDTRVCTLPNAASFGTCPVCQFKALTTSTTKCLVCGYFELSHHDVKHGAELPNIRCDECGEESCVEKNDYLFKCTKCQEIFSEEEIIYCEYCEENYASHSANEGDGSYQNGCEYCDGKLGYLMNKDN